MSSAKGLPSCHSLYIILSDHMSTYLRYYSSLSGCHAVLSILSKGVYKHSSVERITTGSLYINSTCWYALCLIPLLLSFGRVRALTPPKLGGVMWIPCLQKNTPMENVEAHFVFQTSFLEAMLGELGRLSCLEPRHGSFSSTFRRRILCGGYIAERIPATGLWKAPMDGPSTRVQREQ